PAPGDSIVVMGRGFVAGILPLVLVLALALVHAPVPADADGGDDRALLAHGRQLARGEPYKVRISAALWLSRRSPTDARAVRLLVRALGRDRERTVRQVAAAALGEMIDHTTPAATLAEVTAALERAGRGDRDRRVRTRAGRALAAIRA